MALGGEPELRRVPVVTQRGAGLGGDVGTDTLELWAHRTEREDKRAHHDGEGNRHDPRATRPGRPLHLGF